LSTARGGAFIVFGSVGIEDDSPMTGAWAMRPLITSDVELLRMATLVNVNWTGEERFTYGDIDRSGHIRHYFDVRPDRGDFGFVAERDGLAVGVAWVLFFDASDPGFGFIADGIPELSVTVWSGYRGEGVGRSLILAALDHALACGVRRVGLSVEAHNPAVFLYRSLGFERAEGAADGTYVVELLGAGCER
jgi:GNAT superfamily N-acetyltransferase